MNKILISLLVLLFISCGGNEESQMERKGYKKATVINMDLDGCQYVLQLETGEKVEPENLDDEFKADGLEIWVKYKADKEKVGACMIGPIVDIQEIRLQ